MKLSVPTRQVALVGNPNCGKTTLFNQLTGHRGRVGNYAGVTVERKTALVRGLSAPAELIDLPGMYSISARSLDEMVAADVLMGNRPESPKPPDLLLIVADASNLERNLFLATQVIESGVPFALLLNMVDVALANGIRIDADELSRRLGAPVFPVVAVKGEGLDAVRHWLDNVDASAGGAAGVVNFPPAFEGGLDSLQEAIASTDLPDAVRSRFLLRRCLLESGGIAEKRLLATGGDQAARMLSDAREAIASAGLKLVSLEARTRYAAIREMLDGVREMPSERIETRSDRIDRVLLHPVWGTGIFLALMLLVFQSIYAWSAPLMEMTEGLFAALGGFVEGSLPSGPVASFLSGGLIAGVGGVLVFLPQIVFLFLFIAILEDCGYMARAAFLADRLFSRVGLSGRSFIPLLSSFACAVPGIMATRTISDRRDRLATIMVAPLMSCSARLPVYVLMIAAFVPGAMIGGVLNLQGLVLLAMYLVGPAVGVVVALLLRRTFLKGPKPTFLMELPPYRMPRRRAVAVHLLGRAGSFLKRAGTVILAVAIVVWAASYYPRPAAIEDEVRERFAERIALAETSEETAALEAELDNAIGAAYIEQSILGRAGKVIEPVVAPLGWDWRIGMAVVASFPAREVVIATLGIIFEVGEADEQSDDLRGKLQNAEHADGRPLFTLPVALSIMVFFALCSQCAATLAVIQRETNSWRWPLFTFAYMTVLAWAGAFLTYHVFTLLLG